MLIKFIFVIIALVQKVGFQSLYLEGIDNKMKSLKVAQSKDDEGGVGDGAVNACVMMCMIVCCCVCDVVCVRVSMVVRMIMMNRMVVGELGRWND